MGVAAWLSYRHRTARRRRRDVDEFRAAGLVSAPHDFGSIANNAVSVAGLALPANCRLGVEHSAQTAEGDVVLEETGGRSVAVRAGAAGQVVPVIAWFERGKTLNIRRADGAPAGDVQIYLDTRFFWLRVGTATFSA